MKTLKIGDRVMFKASVVERCGHSKDVADMRGVVLSSEMCSGKVVRVDTEGTYPNEEGYSIRYFPISNLMEVGEK